MNLSQKTQMILFPLIPCGFTLLDILIIKILQTFNDVGSGTFVFTVGLFLMVFSIAALTAAWLWVGSKSYLIQKKYWKALLFFNSIGFLCLLFALFYYTHATVNLPIDGFAWWILGLSGSPELDLIAGIYSTGYFVGGILAVFVLKPVIYPISVVLINTIISLLVFSLGYFYRRSKEIETSKAAETYKSKVES